MSDTTFRTPVADTPVAPSTPSEPGDVAVGSEVKETSLLASYEEETGRPYTADYFDLKNMWSREPGLQRDLQEINSYVLEQVKSGTLDNSTRSAEKFIKDMERSAGLTRYESANTRIAKLLAYIDFKRTVNG